MFIFTDIIIDRYRVYNNLLDIFSFTLIPQHYYKLNFLST